MIKKAKIVGGQNFFILDEDGVEALLNKIPVTSKDYAQAEKLQQDGIASMLGFTFISLPDPIPPLAGGTIRPYIALNSAAMGFCTRDVVAARVKPRPDRSDALQAYYAMEHGAARFIDEFAHVRAAPRRNRRQRMLGRHRAERDAHDRVGAGGEHP